DLLRMAAFAVAMESYRLDPTQIDSAAIVADGLQALGMAEASPADLVDAVKAHPDSRVVGAALGATLRAMAGEAEAQDSDSARRDLGRCSPRARADRAPSERFEIGCRPSPASPSGRGHGKRSGASRRDPAHDERYRARVGRRSGGANAAHGSAERAGERAQC